METDLHPAQRDSKYYYRTSSDVNTKYSSILHSSEKSETET
ncbi:MAG TPA: hypothetical protein VN514_11595 [Ignavibacteria bacterium]|nr:hypothetical protein [Ignavibacteria bacterium]